MQTMTELPRTTLYYKEGGSDKVYQCQIEPAGERFVVNFAYGRRGSTLNTGTKTNVPVDLESAQRIFDKLVREKQAKGYTEGQTGTPYQHTSNEGKVTGIQCQLLNPVEEADLPALINDKHWLMQEKKDGRRVLIQKHGNTVVGINRKGLVIGLPEEIVTVAVKFDEDFIIDGECVGTSYHAFDYLERDGDCIRQESYLTRLGLLSDLLAEKGNPDSCIQLIECCFWAEGKRQLLDQYRRQGAEGVVFKRDDAPYTPGRPNSGGTQLKHKFYSTASFVVAGLNEAKRSIRLGLFDNGQKEAGNVTIPPNQPIPRVGEVVEVRYLYAFRESGSVYQPVYLGRRSDIAITECTTAQLKFKSSNSEED